VAAVPRWHNLLYWRLRYLRLLFIEGQMATAAKVIGCAELNQKATVAPYNLPGIYRGKSSSHQKVGVARASKTQEPNAWFQSHA
jgi:hypothetical protein